jgi:hypothetical protein
MSEFLLLPSNVKSDQRVLIEYGDQNVYAIPLYKTTEQHTVLMKNYSMILTFLILIFIFLFIVFLYATEARLSLTRGKINQQDRILIWDVV